MSKWRNEKADVSVLSTAPYDPRFSSTVDQSKVCTTHSQPSTPSMLSSLACLALSRTY